MKKTIEEVVSLEKLKWFMSDGIGGLDETIKVSEIWDELNKIITGAKYQSDQMYSEDEVKELFFKFLFDRGIGREVQNVPQWFNLNKKK